MSTFFAILIVATAIVAPWATISAFERNSRLTGWLMTLTAVACHIGTWVIIFSDKRIAFFCMVPWAVYEIVLSFIPAGIVEMEEDEKAAAAEAAANKG